MRRCGRRPWRPRGTLRCRGPSRTPPLRGSLRTLSGRRTPGSTRGLDLLWDIKTIHGGSDSYTCALARDAQGGAVTQRARQVDAEYARIALRLDRGVAGAVTGRLREWPAVRAQYEASPYPRWTGVVAPNPIELDSSAPGLSV